MWDEELVFDPRAVFQAIGPSRPWIRLERFDSLRAVVLVEAFGSSEEDDC